MAVAVVVASVEVAVLVAAASEEAAVAEAVAAVPQEVGRGRQ